MGMRNFSWLLLAASIAAEVVGTLALRHADGFTRALPSAVVAAAYALAIWLMALAVRQLEVGLAYAVWAGAGTALIARDPYAAFARLAALFETRAAPEPGVRAKGCSDPALAFTSVR